MKPEKMVTITFRVRESLHRKLRERANKHGQKIQFVAGQAIEEHLDKPYYVDEAGKAS